MNIFQDLKNQYANNGIVQKLIFWNIGVFLLTIIFFYDFKSGAFLFPKWLVLYSSFSDVFGINILAKINRTMIFWAFLLEYLVNLLNSFNVILPCSSI